jgi:hypothetical protein
MNNEDLVHLTWVGQGTHNGAMYLHNRTRTSGIDIVTAMRSTNVIGREILRQTWDVENAPTLMIRMEAVPGGTVEIEARV